MEGRNGVLETIGTAPTQAFVGREREFGVLARAVDLVGRRVATQPVVVVGPAGVGRSAFLLEATRRVVPDGWVANMGRHGRWQSLGASLAEAFLGAVERMLVRRPGSEPIRRLGDTVAAFGSAVHETGAGPLDAALSKLLRIAAAETLELPGSFIVMLDDVQDAPLDEQAVLWENLEYASKTGSPFLVFSSYRGTLTSHGREQLNLVQIPALDEGEAAALARSHGYSLKLSGLSRLMELSAGLPSNIVRYLERCTNNRDSVTSAVLDAAHLDLSRIEARTGTPSGADVSSPLRVAGARSLANLARTTSVLERLTAPQHRFLRSLAELSPNGEAVSFAYLRRSLGDAVRFGDGVSPVTVLHKQLHDLGLVSALSEGYLTFSDPALAVVLRKRV